MSVLIICCIIFSASAVGYAVIPLLNRKTEWLTYAQYVTHLEVPEDRGGVDSAVLIIAANLLLIIAIIYNYVIIKNYILYILTSSNNF